VEKQGLLRSLEPRSNAQTNVIQLGAARLINFSSNDYLGLASEALTPSEMAAAEQFGFGAGASRLVVGDTHLHHELEAALAALDGSEAALLMNSGYAANTGTIPALVDARDAVFSDALNHASIVDGCRLSRASIGVYRHRDVEHLETLLHGSQARRKLVVTDAVFSMDGDLAPLQKLRATCDRFGAALMVDEAHSTGIFHENGEGLCFHDGVTADIKVGTLSKALGCFGAWVSSTAQVRTLLLNRVRPFIFSTALPPPWCARALQAVSRVKLAHRERATLWRSIAFLASALRSLGFQAQSDSAIFSVVLGTPERAVQASTFLRSEGLLVKAIRPPTVPENTSRLRIAVTSMHTREQLEKLVGALGEWNRFS
jgi:8-amino-7-oxononanoate synthase